MPSRRRHEVDPRNQRQTAGRIFNRRQQRGSVSKVSATECRVEGMAVPESGGKQGETEW